MSNSKNFGTKSNEYIVTVASWESRFLIGSKRLIQTVKPKVFLMSYCKEYAAISEPNRVAIHDFCKERNVKCVDNALSFIDPVASWNSTKDFLRFNDIFGKDVTIDISTMPRETIWTSLFFLRNFNCNISYIYYSPESYNDSWLSQEPEKPRIVFKLGGISKLGSSTVLLIVSGFDIDRVNQLINYFDPELTIIGMQSGTQMKNYEKNINKCELEFKSRNNIKIFSLDAYAPDRGYEAIKKAILPYISDHNVVLSSLGPKLSAIALFRLHEDYDDLALAYAPSKKFNPEYSFGIGDEFTGSLL